MNIAGVRSKRAIVLVDGAGYWIQQEQPVRLDTLLLAFMKEVGGTDRANP